MKGKYVAAIAILLGVVAGSMFFVSAPSVYAGGGGAATNGSGSSGGSSGWRLEHGFGWVRYDADPNKMPQDGFRKFLDGNTAQQRLIKSAQFWASKVNECKGYGASSIDVFIIRAPGGSAMGYDYQGSYDNDPTRITATKPYSWVDGGRAYVISDNTALDDFKDYRKAVKKDGGTGIDLKWGSEVGLICSNIEEGESWELDANSSVNKSTAQPGDNVTFTHSVWNKASSKDRARYSWRIMQNNSYVPGTVDSVEDAGQGTKHPDARKVKIQIPEGATDGQQICQRIEYSNKFGPKTTQWNFPDPPPWDKDHGPASSGSVCVTVKSQPPETGWCTYWTSNNPPTVYFSSSGKTHEQRTHVWSDGVVDRSSSTGAGINTRITGNNSEEWNVYANKKEAVYNVQREYKKDDGTWTDVPNGYTQYKFTCYQASCKVTVVGDPSLGGGSRVKAGSQYTVRIQIDNPLLANNLWLTSMRNGNGSKADPNSGYSLVARQDGTNKFGKLGYGIPPGGSSDPEDIEMTLTAPNDVGAAKTAAFHAEYYGHPSIVDFGSSCDAPIDVYKQATFTYLPVASLDSEEDPTKVTYATGVNNDSGVTVKLKTHHDVYKVSPFEWKDAASPDTLVNGPNVSLNSSKPITSAKAGDEYCANIWSGQVSMRVISALVNASGDYINPVYGPATPACTKVHNKPYFKIYGSGAQAGGEFSDVDSSCAVGGTLAGWNDTSQRKGADAKARGASSELSSLAREKIYGFATGQTRSVGMGMKSPTELTFANKDVTILNGGESPTLGGEMGGGGWCLPKVDEPDAANITDMGTGASPVASTDNTGSWSRKYAPSSGYLTLRGRILEPGANQSIFVKGDVYIDSNIRYKDSDWSTSNIPSFVLKATGNIYISKDVAQLDGLYIAQGTKQGGTIKKGKIFTCSYAGAALSGASMHADCNKQLVVRGAFVAEQVNLMRTGGTLRNAEGGEHPRPSGTETTQTTVQKPSSENCRLILFDDNGSFGNATFQSRDDMLGALTSAGTHVTCRQNVSSRFCPAVALSTVPVPDSCKANSSKRAEYPKAWCKSSDFAAKTCSIRVQSGEACSYATEQLTRQSCKFPPISETVVTSTSSVDQSAPILDCANGNMYVRVTGYDFTCAAEVFDFSPEMYLSSPAIRKGIGNAPAWQMLISLPPVL